MKSDNFDQRPLPLSSAGGSGAGRAGALMFAREGARVIVGDIDPKGGEETIKTIKDAGGEASFVRTDVGKVEDVRRLVETTVGLYGKLNILWNHAGIPGPGNLESTEEAEFDRAMAINVKGGFFALTIYNSHGKGLWCPETTQVHRGTTNPTTSVIS